MKRWFFTLLLFAILVSALPIYAQEGVKELPTGFWPNGYDKISRASGVLAQSGETIARAEVVIGPKIEVEIVWNSQGLGHISPIFVISDSSGVETHRYQANLPDTGHAIVQMPFFTGDYDIWISFGEPYGASQITRLQNVVHVLRAITHGESTGITLEWTPNPEGPEEITLEILYFRWDSIAHELVQIGSGTITIDTQTGQIIGRTILHLDSPAWTSHIQISCPTGEYTIPTVPSYRTAGVELLFASDGELQATEDEGVCVPSDGGEIELKVEFPWGENTWLAFTKPGMPTPQTVEVIGPIVGPTDHWIGQIFTKPGTVSVTVTRDSETIGEASLEVPACLQKTYLSVIYK